MDDFDKISKANIDENYAKINLADNPGNEEKYKSQKSVYCTSLAIQKKIALQKTLIKKQKQIITW